MARDLVFETNTHPGLCMLGPFLYFHEPQSSYPGDFLHGKYYDFYATKGENVRVSSLPPTQFGTVKILDELGNVLESAPVINNEANLLIGKYHFPLAAQIKLYEKNVEIASTLVTQQMYGGDEYSVNFNPVLDPIGDQTASESDLLTFTATATDADLPADPLTFSLAGAPTGASIDPVTGVFTWTPPEGKGNVSFDVIVSDGLVSDSETINVILSQIENPPIAADDESRTQVNKAVPINVVGNDVDPEGGALAVEVVTNPSNGIASVNPDGTILYTPDTDFYVTDTFSYKITDIAGLEDIGNVSVNSTTIKTQLVKIVVPTGLDTITVSDFVPVDADNTISLISGITQHAKGYLANTNQQPRDISVRVELSSDGTSITATRDTASATGSDEVWVSLIEYTGSPGGDNEFIVRDRTVNLWAHQQATAFSRLIELSQNRPRHYFQLHK